MSNAQILPFQWLADDVLMLQKAAATFDHEVGCNVILLVQRSERQIRDTLFVKVLFHVLVAEQTNMVEVTVQSITEISQRKVHFYPVEAIVLTVKFIFPAFTKNIFCKKILSSSFLNKKYFFMNKKYFCLKMSKKSCVFLSD